MTPEFFDGLMDLIDHKIATALKHGAGLKTKVLSEKQAALRDILIVKKESIPEEPADPVVELQSDVLAARLVTLRRERANIEQSDDRAYTNGRLRDIDKEIREVQLHINALENKRDLA